MSWSVIIPHLNACFQKWRTDFREVFLHAKLIRNRIYSSSAVRYSHPFSDLIRWPSLKLSRILVPQYGDILGLTEANPEVHLQLLDCIKVYSTLVLGQSDLIRAVTFRDPGPGPRGTEGVSHPRI